jgi:hypothetical protein
METSKEVRCYKALLDEFCSLAIVPSGAMTPLQTLREQALDLFLSEELGPEPAVLWRRAFHHKNSW